MQNAALSRREPESFKTPLLLNRRRWDKRIRPSRARRRQLAAGPPSATLVGMRITTAERRWWAVIAEQECSGLSAREFAEEMGGSEIERNCGITLTGLAVGTIPSIHGTLGRERGSARGPRAFPDPVAWRGMVILARGPRGFPGDRLGGLRQRRRSRRTGAAFPTVPRTAMRDYQQDLV